MSKQPGQMVYDGRTVSFPTDGTPEPGDAVAIDGGQVTQGTDTNNPIGVLSDQAPAAADQEAGEDVPVHVTGVVVANVAAGTAAGDGLAGTTTAGELGAGDEFDAFSDEGGQFKQHDTSDVSLEAGYAAVHLG